MLGRSANGKMFQFSIRFEQHWIGMRSGWATPLIILLGSLQRVRSQLARETMRSHRPETAKTATATSSIEIENTSLGTIAPNDSLIGYRYI